jgi:hypothetical protein
MIPNTELSDIGADLSDDSRHLVAEHRWRRNDVVRGEQYVGVTESGRLHVDQNFAPHRGSDIDVFKIKSVSECIDDERFHPRHPYVQSSLQMVSW